MFIASSGKEGKQPKVKAAENALPPTARPQIDLRIASGAG